tara:strand:- start:388 stop:1452 length:1065 start_codon:yes stop_codon:yes gene_type:complete
MSQSPIKKILKKSLEIIKRTLLSILNFFKLELYRLSSDEFWAGTDDDQLALVTRRDESASSFKKLFVYYGMRIMALFYTDPTPEKIELDSEIKNGIDSLLGINEKRSLFLYLLFTDAVYETANYEGSLKDSYGDNEEYLFQFLSENTLSYFTQNKEVISSILENGMLQPALSYTWEQAEIPDHFETVKSRAELDSEIRLMIDIIDEKKWLERLLIILSGGWNYADNFCEAVADNDKDNISFFIQYSQLWERLTLKGMHYQAYAYAESLKGSDDRKRSSENNENAEALLIDSKRKECLAVLGLESNATHEQIKKRYRQIAQKEHPDKSPNKDANKEFKEINIAYDFLKKYYLSKN